MKVVSTSFELEFDTLEEAFEHVMAVANVSRVTIHRDFRFERYDNATHYEPAVFYKVSYVVRDPFN